MHYFVCHCRDVLSAPCHGLPTNSGRTFCHPLPVKEEALQGASSLSRCQCTLNAQPRLLHECRISSQCLESLNQKLIGCRTGGFFVQSSSLLHHRPGYCGRRRLHIAGVLPRRLPRLSLLANVDMKLYCPAKLIHEAERPCLMII